ncbi:MAG: S-methyl-5-thioribose-1-phosphate isomerase [Arcobacteraceae bacterium]|nr:S-methyl-5-thioribose-1-phosphate isomerase [Arcobacteraceae bacterium]
MNGQYKALWLNKDENLVVLDQRLLPFEKKEVIITNTQECIDAIKDMTVRGAGVIGNTAAFGVYLASKEAGFDIEKLKILSNKIRESRPTAVNLMWAVDRMVAVATTCSKETMCAVLKQEAINITDEEVIATQKIATYGADEFEKIVEKKGKSKEDTINILTHCNAGWLAIVDLGSALAPIYELQKRGRKVHVWVDETRPRNQGANLTAWELSQDNVPHTVIADNTGGYLMQQGMVDICITGADRVSRNGDVANKIGTYLKALSAKDNDIPFFVALPTSTFDFEIYDGVKDIPIETRSEDEVKFIRGIDKKGEIQELQIVQSVSNAINYGFDITPARLVSGLITQRGITKADLKSIEKEFSDLL